MCALCHYFRTVKAKALQRLQKGEKGLFLRQIGRAGEVRGVSGSMDLFLWPWIRI